METATSDDLRREFAAFLEAHHITISSASRSMAVSQAALSTWCNDKFRGDKTKMERNVRAFLIREAQRVTAIAKATPFVETTVARRIHEAAEICHILGRMGLCAGPSGVGKTYAVKEYVKKNPQVILIEGHLRMATSDVMREIHRATGGDGRGTVHAMIMEIVAKLKDSGRLIIVDEAEHLHCNTLDQIRRIHDWAGVGVMYVGLDRFRGQVRSLRGDYEYIVNRIAVPVVIEELTKDDVEDLVSAIIPNAKPLMRTFVKQSRGNARRLDTLVRETMRLHDIDPETNELTPDLVEFAANTMEV
jgi:DNA transposition AAA+ family ATPase